MSRFKTFLVFGPNGIGKGTNAKAAGALPGYLHFSTGDMFRALVARVKEGTASELEKRIDQIMKSGGLVDDETTVKLARENLESAVSEGSFDPETDYLLLDGLPRNVEQAEMVEPFIEICGVLHVTAAREVAVARITGRAIKEGRKDDYSSHDRLLLVSYMVIIFMNPPLYSLAPSGTRVTTFLFLRPKYSPATRLTSSLVTPRYFPGTSGIPR